MLMFSDLRQGTERTTEVFAEISQKVGCITDLLGNKTEPSVD